MEDERTAEAEDPKSPLDCQLGGVSGMAEYGEETRLSIRSSGISKWPFVHQPLQEARLPSRADRGRDTMNRWIAAHCNSKRHYVDDHRLRLLLISLSPWSGRGRNQRSLTWKLYV